MSISDWSSYVCSSDLGPAAGIRQAQQFQRALHGAVFTVASVQRNEHAVESCCGQVGQRTLAGLAKMGVDSRRLQRLLHTLARHDRKSVAQGTSVAVRGNRGV